LIDQVDDQLVSWVRGTLGDIAVSLQPPDKAATGQGISLYLLSLAENPALQGARRTPLQFWLRYLVTAWAEKPSEAHAILGELLLAAMDTPEYEVELDNIPSTIWPGFGITPRPAFLLRVPVRRERVQRSAPLVREPLRVKWIETVRLNGAVHGPGDGPLPGVKIALMPQVGDTPLAAEYARLCPATVTGADGLFTFASVPVQPRYTFFIQIKDQELFASLDNGPLILRWDLLAVTATGRDGEPGAGGLLRFSRNSSDSQGLRLLCKAGEEPLPGLRVEYPALQPAARLNAKGEGYLLLQEKALGQAGQWLPALRGELVSADQQPLPGATIECPSLGLRASTDAEGAFHLKSTHHPRL
jgi:hypothetical protein